MLESENTNNSIDESDDEDQDRGSVVEDVCFLVILLDSNIYPTKYQEQCSSYGLNRTFIVEIDPLGFD